MRWPTRNYVAKVKLESLLKVFVNEIKIDNCWSISRLHFNLPETIRANIAGCIFSFCPGLSFKVGDNERMNVMEVRSQFPRRYFLSALI